jgi:tetrapyrrole methylase family protein / MazG family protein
MKQSKRVATVRRSSFIDGIPDSLPSLRRAYLVTEKASTVGFDWPNIEGVFGKLDEELREFKGALSIQSRRRVREEFGDILFALVNIARVLRINPEEALDKTIEKFISRFHYIEASLRKKGKSLHQSSLDEMDKLWEVAKKRKR